MSEKLQIFKIVSPQDLVRAGHPKIEATPLLTEKNFNIPPLNRNSGVIPSEELFSNNVKSGPFYSYLIRDAHIHYRFGVVTIDDFVLCDTIAHFPTYLFPESGIRDNNLFVFPVNDKNVHISRACHVMHCNIDNYYHFNIDIIGRGIYCLLLGKDGSLTSENLTILVPSMKYPYQGEVFSIINKYKLPYIMLDGNASVVVDTSSVFQASSCSRTIFSMERGN